MRIALVMATSKNYHAGGAERRFLRLASYIAKKEKNISIEIIFHGKYNNSEKLVSQFLITTENNIKIIEIKDKVLIIKLKQKKYDAIHFVLISKRLFFIYPLLKKVESKKILTIAASTIAENRFDSIIQKIAYKRILKQVDILDLLYPGKEEKILNFAKKQKINHITRDSIFTTPFPFTLLDKFYPSEKKENIIVFAGIMSCHKQPELLMKAVRIVYNFLIEEKYRILFCGDGPEKSELEKQKLSFDNNGIIEFTGSIDVAELFSKSKIFVSLQKLENYPSQALVEAISSGNYIIATDVGNTHLLVKPDFGTLIESTPEVLAQALNNMVTALKDEKVQEEKKTKGRDFAERYFHIKNQASYFKDIWLHLKERN